MLSSLQVSVLDGIGGLASSDLYDSPLAAVLQLLSDSNTRPSTTASSGSAMSLTGATVVNVVDGVAKFSGLRLQAPPGTSVRLQVLLSGSHAHQVPPLSFEVLVKPCGAGQLTVEGAGEEQQTSAAAAVASSCRQCPLPQFSFSAKASECSQCPNNMVCSGAAPVPVDGFYQQHPYSSSVRECRNPSACIYPDRLTRLHQIQQILSGIDTPPAAAVAAYQQSQCAQGYAGSGCSHCNSDGGYGMHTGLGICQKCPGLLASILGFIAARVFDLLAVFAIVIVWCYGGLWATIWLQHTRETAGDEMMDLPRFIFDMVGPHRRLWYLLTATSATAAFLLLVSAKHKVQ